MKPRLTVVGTASDVVNPYPGMLYDEMERRGHRVVRAPVTGALRLRARGFRPVVHLHWVDARLREPSVLKAALAAVGYLTRLAFLRAVGCRFVWTFHNLSAHDGLHPRIEALLHRMVLAMSSRVITFGAATALPLAQRYGRVASSKVVSIPHPNYARSYAPRVPTEQARTALGLPGSGRVLLVFGRMEPYKNVPEIVDVFRRLAGPDDRLLVAGRSSGAVEGALALAVSADDRVILRLEQIPDEEVPRYFSAADWLVLNHEALVNSGVLMLAVTFGVPVVAPDMPGVVDVLGADGGGGILFDRQEGGLPAAMAEAMASVPSAASMQRIMERTTLEFVADETERLYIEVAAH